MASSTSSAAAAAAAVPSPGGGGGGPSSTSTSSRRKELTRALRSAFAFSNIHDNAAAAAAAASSSSLFEGYAPPESLLDLIDDYAGSSDVQRSQHHPPPAAAASTASASVPAGSSSAHGSQTGGAGGVPTGSGSASGPGSGSATTTTTAAAVQAGTTSGGAAGPTASAAGGGGGGLGSGLTGREKDVRRIQDALLEDCFNEGILALAALASRTNSSPDIAALHARARSALILVLDKFASMDSDVVSPLEVRYIWWERLLQPALLHSPGATASSSGHASAGHAHEKGKRASVDDAKARLAVSTADFIALGRSASRAARELVLRALCHDPEERDNTKWRNELLSVCFDSEPDSLAHRNLQEVLTGFYKAHPKIFFTSIYAQLDHRPAEALALLNAAIRTHPLPAFQAFHTPLFSGILALLNDITIPSPGEQHSASTSTSTRSHDLVWVSLALTSLSMLLPRLPSVLDSQLDALFVTLLRTMLWHTRAFRRSNTALNTLPSADESKTPSSHASSSAHANLNAGNDVEDDEAAEQYAAGPLPPLLDYFTTLYGLFPANLCYFLGDSLRWLRSYRRRLARRRSRAHSTASSSGGAGAAAGAGEEASGSAGPRRAAGGESSTSGGDDDFGDDSGTDGGRDGPGSSSSRTAAGQAHRSSRAHGKGRRSKLKKQKKDAAIKSKKEKESAKQKEREQRRRQGLGSTQAGDSPPGQHSLGDVHEGIPMSSGMTRDASASSSGMSYGSSRAEAGAGDPSRADERDAKQGGATSVSASASSESDQGEESDQAMEDSQALPEELLKLDWELAKALSHRYLVQHALSSGALMTPEAEFSRNKLRFKKLETSDIFDEISRTRIIRPPAATQARTHFATSTLARTYSEGTASAHVVSGSAAHVEPGEETVVSPLSAVVSPQLSSAHTVLPPAQLPPPSFGAGPAQRSDSIGATATALGAGLSSLGTSDKVLLLSSQLGFEIYLKQHLVQRLGSDLRERVTLGGLEADKQNLQHNIRTLKSQLATTNDKLEQLRHESGLSRERLNGYSQQQVARVERLREQRSAWQAEQRDWRSKLEDTQGALAAVQERFTASERAMFELLAEERTAKEEREKKEREREEEVQSLRKLVEELQGRLAPKETGGKPDEDAAHEMAEAEDAPTEHT